MVIASRAQLTMLANSVSRPSTRFLLTRRKYRLGAQRLTIWLHDMFKAFRTGLSGKLIPFYHLYSSFDNIYAVLDRSLHWSFQTHRYFGTEGMLVKKHRMVTLLPLELPESPSLTPIGPAVNDQVSCAPNFSFGEQSAFILVS